MGNLNTSKNKVVTSVPTAPVTDFEITPAWEAWVIENLLDAVSPEALAAEMEARGVSLSIAQSEIARLINSATFKSLVQLKKENAQLHQVLKLQRELAEKSEHQAQISRIKPVDEVNFFNHYYRHNQPVVLEGLAKDWVALERWTPTYLTQILGEEEVEVTTERESDPDYDMNFKKHSTTMLMRDFLQKVQMVGKSNDIYMTANNRMMERPAFLKLLDDVKPPLSYVHGDTFAGCSSLWIGPEGTKTPLHHDNTNIVFCQITGRKEFHMVSPLETILFKWATRTYYNKANLNPVDLKQFPELADVQIHKLILEPGDALFIPVGWWHQVRSLDFSISLSFTNLLRHNRFDWYHPENCR